MLGSEEAFFILHKRKSGKGPFEEGLSISSLLQSFQKNFTAFGKKKKGVNISREYFTITATSYDLFQKDI
jgi:hypothetical protein